MNKIFSTLALVCCVVAALAQGPTQRIALLNLQQAKTVESSKAGQFGLTDINGNQKYAQFTEIDLVPIAYTPTATGNTQNYSEFVTTATGDVWYIDWQGRGKKINGGGTSCDYDYRQIRDNSCPATISDSIYKYKYVAIGARYVWPLAQLLVSDSTNEGAVVIAGQRGSSLVLYNQIGGKFSTLQQAGSSANLTIDSTGSFTIQYAAGGTPALPGSTTPLMQMSAQDSTLRLNAFNSARLADTAALNNVAYFDATGKFRKRPVTDLPASGFSVGSTNYLQKVAGPTALSNSLLYEDAAKIGIGTITPAFRLDMVGTASIAARTFGINGTPVAYLPDQTTFPGSTSYGAGLRYMTNSSPGQGWYNTALGVGALDSVRTGYGNTGIGYLALQRVRTAFDNTGIGAKALQWLEFGDDNNGLGINAGSSLVSGSNNNFIGGDAGQFITGGGGSVYFGNEAGRYYGPGVSNNLTAATNSIFMGHRSRAGANNSVNEIVIGWETIGNGNNSVVLGNDTIATTILNGKVGIRTRTPTTWLDVKGNDAAVGGVEAHMQLRRDTRSGLSYPQTGTFYVGNSGRAHRWGSYDPMTRVDLRLNRQTSGTPTFAEQQVMTWTDDGFVGIGDTMPLAKLQVGSIVGGVPLERGDILINQATVNGGNGGLELNLDPTGAGYGFRLYGAFNGLSAYYLGFQARVNSNTYTTRMFMSGGGELGLGVEPTQRLDLLNGTARFRDFTTAGNVLTHSSTGVVASSTPASIVAAAGGITGAAAAGQVAYFTNSTVLAGHNDFFLDVTNKRLGIGTSTPAFRLELAGTANVAQRKMGINGVQTMYLPDQTIGTAFRGSVFFGTGGNSLSHTTASEGYDNTGVGINALLGITTGTGNNAVGFQSMYYNTTGNYNNAIGLSALFGNTTGQFNIGIGSYALLSNTSGVYNIALGHEALLNSTGSNNFAFGAAALRDNTSGVQNIAIGYNTGRGITTGSNNVIIGASITGLASGLNNNIIIGDGAGNRRINVDDDGSTGIGVIAPTANLHVKAGLSSAAGGQIKLDSSAELSVKEKGVLNYIGKSFSTTLNDSLRVTLPGVIWGDTDAAKSVGTSETNLYVKNIKGRTFNNVGSSIHSVICGNLADATSVNAQLRFYLGGTLIGDTGAAAVTAVSGWQADVYIENTGSNILQTCVKIFAPGLTGQIFVTNTTLTSLSLGNPLQFKVTATATGAGATNDDITAQWQKATFYPTERP